MVTIKEIKELKEYLITKRHAKRLKQQEEYQSYYEDTFDVPTIKDSKFIVRTGKAARMIDGPIEHIITNNPQVFRNTGNKEKDGRVAALLNHWADRLKRQNPNPFREFPKNMQLLGEAWLYLPHNTQYKTDDSRSLPVHFIPLNPMVIFIDDLAGEEDGIPSRVLVSYERVAGQIRELYPHWGGKYSDSDKLIPFLAYWDSETRYFEAADEPLLRDGSGDLANGTGLQKNPYGFVPFVHSYSGYGRGAVDGDPASLAMGRLHNVTDLLKEQCQIRSEINLLIYKYGHKATDLIYRAEGPEPTGDIGEEYSREIDAFNIIGLPEGAEIKESEAKLPDTPLYQHLINIETQIGMEDPPIFSGLSTGTSGRQEDVVREAALKRYDTLVENTAYAFATAFGCALNISEKMGLKLPEIRKDDIHGDYTCNLELKASDPIIADRLSLQGRTLVQVGQLSLRTNLIKYQGYTEEEADDEIDNILAERYMFQSPDIAELMQVRAAEKSGMAEDIQGLRARREAIEQKIKQFPLGNQFGSQGGSPRIGEVKKPQGTEQSEYARGIRSPAGARE